MLESVSQERSIGVLGASRAVVASLGERAGVALECLGASWGPRRPQTAASAAYDRFKIVSRWLKIAQHRHSMPETVSRGRHEGAR